MCRTAFLQVCVPTMVQLPTLSAHVNLRHALHDAQACLSKGCLCIRAHNKK